MHKVIRELESRADDPDAGWDERDALKHWAQLCGPAAVSKYLHNFLLNEIGLRDRSQLLQYQWRLAKLFTYMLRNGLPMEQLQIGSFKESLFQARNAEEALLVALNACATVTKEVAEIDVPDLFGAWFKGIQGQRTGSESSLAAVCLSFLRLDNTCLDIGDFYGSGLQNTQLQRLRAHFTNFENADLSQANLSEAILYGANLSEVNLYRANLNKANLSRSNLNGANLDRANLNGTHLRRAHLSGAHLSGADLSGADLRGADLSGADLTGANLTGANLRDADFTGSNLEGAIFDPEAMKLAIGYKSSKNLK